MTSVSSIGEVSRARRFALLPRSPRPYRTLRLALMAILSFSPLTAAAQTTDSSDLTGLWSARKRFGPDARGPLIITRTGSSYTAEIVGLTLPATMRDGELTFELPSRDGGFRGRIEKNGAIRGTWFQAPPGSIAAATPVKLLPSRANRWSGTVVPNEDEQTFHLLVQRRPDGSLSAFVRNIERDYGALLGVRGLVREGHRVALMGRRGAQTRDTIVVDGSYNAARQIITLDFPFRGGTYDFRRDNNNLSSFYPRGKTPDRYVYRPPLALDDGWETASVEDVGLDRRGVERAVQQILDMPMDSINAPQLHSLLIARRGKLVVEEYFHGEHRYKPHNTRSGSKSVTATIIGAAMQAGAPIRLSAPVYQVMNGGTFPDGLEPRKRAMTLEHLLTMSSGYFCDDNNDNAPGREDTMWEQTAEPSFYTFTLKVPMAFAPGDTAIYCSANPNLALGVLGRAMGESPYYLFDRLVAEPLGIRNYVWGFDRARNPYGGGGMAFTSRDYIKFGQLMLNGGTWQGRRILSAEYVARATSPLYKIGPRGYGLAWWRYEMPYDNRMIEWFGALGAGGNLVLVFPELDLVVATTGGSYASRGWRYIGGDLVTNYVLPAVK